MSLRLDMPRELVSPNQWNGRHWRVKHRISQEWERELVVAGRGKRLPGRKILYDGYPYVDCRFRVTVERHVPSARNFIRDDDNLRFSVKPLLDALKRQGYIKNDSRKWIEHPTPTQHVTTNGEYRTVVILEPLGAFAEPESAV